MRKTTTCKFHKNLDMNKDVYALRKQVMEIIYQAKKLVPSLPRIDVRITEPKDKRILGTAIMNGCMIWISKETVKNTKILKQTVYHEILHAVYGMQHDETCPMMKAVRTFTLSSEKCDEIFLKHTKF